MSEIWSLIVAYREQHGNRPVSLKVPPELFKSAYEELGQIHSNMRFGLAPKKAEIPSSYELYGVRIEQE